MNKLDEEIFEFGDENTEELENSANSFDYDAISGLGESDYENEDLFKVDEDSSNEVEEPTYETNSDVNSVEDDFDFGISGLDYDNQELETENKDLDSQSFEEESAHIEVVREENQEDEEPVKVKRQDPKTKILDDDKRNKIKISDTSMEDLNKLTEYNEPDIEVTDINELFSKVSGNVKEASEIFLKNTEMKEKIDSRFDELKQLQSDIEESKREQKNEINKYKREVLDKLTDKKNEIEKRLNALKELQANLEKEKSEFEQYKKQEQEKIDSAKKEIEDAYDDRREELSHIEDMLRKQKDSLDEERNQLSLDKIQYESDKNELANNLLKFNELVDSFTNGMGGFKGGE